LEETIRVKDREILDFQEQISDLLLHLEGKKVIEQSDLAEDLRSGAIRLVESAHVRTASPKKPARRKR
jgi:hypothetical protein